MSAAGYGPNAMLAFDLACVGFDRAFTRMREETVEQPAPPRERNRRPTVRVPRYSEAELLAVLGIDAADAAPFTASGALNRAVPLDAALLDALDWDDDEPEDAE